MRDVRVTVDYAEHTIPDYAVEEMCRRCHQKATHKIGETSGPDSFHPLTAYLCCGCFSETVAYDCRKYPYDLPSVSEMWSPPTGPGTDPARRGPGPIA